MTSTIKINEHLCQIYPQMPFYAADPSQSPIILTYDHITLRYTGHYHHKPEYFIKAPLCPLIFGDHHNYVNLRKVAICSNQEVIVAVAKNSQNKIRINHYQTTMYGEIEITTAIENWKYRIDENNQTHNNKNNQHYNQILKVFKMFAQNNNIKQLSSGLDILIYKDFIQDEFLYSSQAFLYSLYTSLHTCLLPTPLTSSLLTKLSPLCLPQLTCSQFNTISLINQNKSIPLSFPQGYCIVLANSMTPMPKKLIRGKRFNLRQCEVQIALQLLMAHIGIEKDVTTIQQLMRTMSCDTQQMIDSVEHIIPNRPMNAQEIQSATQKSLIEILRQIPYANNVIDENIRFNPYKRILFFLKQQMLIESLQKSPQSLLSLLKQSSILAETFLQTQSQQISHLLKVVQSYIECYKIVGNGWGGNLLLICKQDKLQPMCEDIVNKFYLAHENKILLSDDIDMYLRVVHKPKNSIAILDPQHQIWFA